MIFILNHLSMARNKPKPTVKKSHKAGKKNKKSIDLNNQVLNQFK